MYPAVQVCLHRAALPRGHPACISSRLSAAVAFALDGQLDEAVAIINRWVAGGTGWGGLLRAQLLAPAAAYQLRWHKCGTGTVATINRCWWRDRFAGQSVTSTSSRTTSSRLLAAMAFALQRQLDKRVAISNEWVAQAKL